MEDGFDSDEPLTDPGLDSDGAGATLGVDSTKATPFDKLPWRKVELPKVTGDAWGLDAEGGLLGLEELDGSEWDRHMASRGGNQAGEEQRDQDFKDQRKRAKKERMALARLERSKNTVEANGGQDGAAVKEEKSSRRTTAGGDSEAEGLEDLEGWDGLATPLLRSLHALSFISPTPVQKATLEAALADRDVVAVAQTGSGKTLAYALPIVHSMLSRPWRSEPHPHAVPVAALVLTPTRELCIQVASHIERLLAPKGKNRSGIPVVAVCGGIAAVKQRSRLDRASELCADLSRGAIVVATPGRLWDLAQTWDELARGIRKVRWLVVDEADRMTEKGRYEEAQKIVDLTRRRPESAQDDWQDEAQDEGRADLQTMVFSATMDAALQRDVKKRARRTETALDRLMDTLDFRDAEPVLIDLSPTKGVVAGLKECKIECLVKEKVPSPSWSRSGG